MNTPDFERIGRSLRANLVQVHGDEESTNTLPDRTNVTRICQLVLNVLFPGYFATRMSDDALGGKALPLLEVELRHQMVRALHFHARSDATVAGDIPKHARLLSDESLGDLVEVSRLVATDIEAAFNNDPAARDRETIVMSYPCIEALAVQRFAHCLYLRGVPLIPRIMTEIIHSRTGIDIHPGASIGESFFIDHGTGVVIGETSRIGTHCVLYQGVTLGAWNPIAKDDNGVMKRGQDNKRHPDLEDHVTVYAGATILGGDTVIGHHSVIGGKVWLTHSVEAHSVVMMEEPKLTIRNRKMKE